MSGNQLRLKKHFQSCIAETKSVMAVPTMQGNDAFVPEEKVEMDPLCSFDHFVA